jgi:tetratricopeptide (TPR) repeat protein
MKKYIFFAVILVLVITIGSYSLSKKEPENTTSALDFQDKASDFFQKHEYSKALEQYKLAINADPSNIDNYINAADIYLLKKNNSEAIDLLNNGVAMVSHPDRLNHKIGQILLLKDDISNALEYFEHALNENPHNWQNTIDLVKVYSYFPDKKKSSIKALEKIDINSGDGLGWKNYYLALLSYEQPSKMISYLQESMNDLDPELKHRIDNLLEISKKMETDKKDSLQNNTLIGYEMIKADLYKYAIPLLESVTSENDEYYAAYMYLGVCYTHLDDLDKASDNLEVATTIDPEQIQPWVFLAQVYSMQNNQKNAIDTYEEALNIDNTNEKVRHDYAKSLVNFGLYSQARNQYKELISQNTENSISYKTELASIDLDLLDEYEEALSLMIEVFDDSENFQTEDNKTKATYLDTFAWAYKKNKQNDEALKYLKQSNEVYPYLASTHYHLGIIYAEIEDRNQAIFYLERAIDLDINGDIGNKASSELENLKNITHENPN